MLYSVFIKLLRSLRVSNKSSILPHPQVVSWSQSLRAQKCPARIGRILGTGGAEPAREPR